MLELGPMKKFFQNNFPLLAIFFVSTLCVQNIFAQNLLTERIRKVTARKTSVFFDKGIFHHIGNKVNSKLNAVRHSFSKQTGQERVVFDFSSQSVPRVYGHISSAEKKIYIDFFDTTLTQNIKLFGSGHFIKEVNFFPLSKESLSVELSLKGKASVDTFYLENPGRFVIDIKR